MVKMRVPNIVVTIPRIAAFIAIAGVVASSIQARTPYTDPVQAQPQQTATHQTVLSTPAPAVSLPASPSQTTTTPTETTATPITTTNVPHSAQPAPVVTPVASASVDSLAPISQNTSTGVQGNSTPSTTNNTNPQGLPGVSVTNSYISTNWAGYMASAGNYTAISASWNVPTATNNAKTTAADATWIGIGGVKSNDLIQVGTLNTVTSQGESSSAFYELLPGKARVITHLTVKPGDNIKASLAEVTAGLWKVTITDVTTGQGFITTKPYTSSGSTAEWIEEDPSATASSQLLPLDTFTPVSFTNGSTVTTNTDNTYATLTIGASNAQPITLVTITGQTVTPVVTPSVLGSDEQSFTVSED